MSAPKIDFEKFIARIVDHVGEMPTASTRPIDHFRHDANGYWSLVRYFDRRTQDGEEQARERHAIRLRSLVALGLIETFERFLKELAAVCIDQLGGRVHDDRFTAIPVNTNTITEHFEEKTLGKALSESAVWLNSNDINKRFSSLLADPFKDGTFKLLPRPDEKKDPDRARRSTLDLLWQLRHSIAHNAGVLTRSDAAKLRLLRRSPVAAPRVLQLTNGDVWYIELFLDDLAAWINGRIATRLAEVLSILHHDDPTLFAPAYVANAISDLFRQSVTVAGASAPA